MTTCDAWLQARAKLEAWHALPGGEKVSQEWPRDTFQPTAWVIGFLEGYSDACSKGKPLASGLDTDGVLERVDKICRSEPGNTPLLIVANKLVELLDRTIWLCHTPRKQ
jgi:hypothetical protein